MRGYHGDKSRLEAQVKELKMKIEGMTCVSCVGKIEKAVSKIKGVESIVISLALHQGTIKYGNIAPS